jgi:hypothetical protein
MHKILAENRKEKRSFRRRIRRRQYNIKTVLKEIGCEVEDWINLAQDRNQLLNLVNMIMTLHII